MYSKYKKLLTVMLDSPLEWITAAALSTHAHISIRSVKNYIAELNASSGGLVGSSRKGYRLDRELAKELLSRRETSLPYTGPERIRLITKKLLRSSSVDIFTACEDELFVSMETIKKDIALVRKQARDFDLETVTRGFSVTLEGSEQNRRKMLSHVLYREFSENIMSLEAIEEVFPRYNVKFVYSTVVESCKARGFFINEYTILALVLDIVISIDRIKHHFGLSEGAPYKNSGDENLLVMDIIRRIEGHFHITYDPFESSELAVIIAGNLIKSNQGSISINTIREFVDPLCAGLIDPLKEQLANYDFIDMDNSRFMPRFMLHVNNLVLRLKNGYTRKNPLTAHIKTSCPMLFDCAVELSDLIRQKTGYSAGEDETAYIALHIGSLLNSHSNMKDKAAALLIFPHYYDYGTKLIDQLTESFHDSLVIQDVVTHAGNPVPATSCDLVISVVDMPHFFEAEYVCINPFMSDRDFEAVRQSIGRVKQKKKRARLLGELKEISHPDIFFTNKTFTARDECIRFMAEKMISRGYAEETFVDEVLSREASYSTRYGSLAVPHSMRLNAKKTGMAVLINDRPVPWGDDGTVNMVFLFSIHKQTRSLFYDIFDNLIVLLLEEENVDKIRNARTHEAFIRSIMDCL